MKRYHVTTFGCQMNEHDSERMRGMLESIGYAEAPARDEADLILFNTCSIREKADDRFVAHLGEAKRLKREDPSRVIGVGGCWAQSVKDEVFARFPFVDVAFGPGQVHKLAEFLTSDSLTAQGYFEFEGFTGRLPAKRMRDYQGWVQISVGCNCGLLVLHRALHPRARGEPPGARAGRRGAPAGRRRGVRGDAPGPERQLLRARPATRGAGQLRRAAGHGRRSRRDPPDSLHEPASQGHARRRDHRPRRARRPCASTSICPCSRGRARCSSACAAPTRASAISSAWR